MRQAVDHQPGDDEAGQLPGDPDDQDHAEEEKSKLDTSGDQDMELEERT